MRLRIAALTLMFALGVVGLVSAQETESFFPRVFSSPTKKVEPAKKAEDKKTETPKAPAASENRVQKAKADLERRQDICLKLRGIGIDSGDEELVRKAELLHQRAWDLYVATTNRVRESERPLGEISAKDLGLTKSTKKGDR